MRPLRSFRILALPLALSFVFAAMPATAFAADPAQKAAAEQLFDDGKKLIEDKHFAEAIPKLEQSQALDPADGTLLALSYAREQTGKLASAWQGYKEALASSEKAGDAQRIQFAKDRLAIVEPRLSKLTVSLPAGSPGANVLLDGKPFVAGTAVPVDGGSHVLRVTAEGKKPYETTVIVGVEMDAKTVAVPMLVDVPADGVALPGPAPSHTASWAAFVTGGVLAGVSVVSFVLAKGAQSDRHDFCSSILDSPSCPEDPSVSRMHRFEAISVVSAGLSLVAIGTGIVLWKKAPETSSAATAQLIVGPSSIALKGAF